MSCIRQKKKKLNSTIPYAAYKVSKTIKSFGWIKELERFCYIEFNVYYRMSNKSYQCTSYDDQILLISSFYDPITLCFN